MSSAIFCGGSTKSMVMVPLSLQPSFKSFTPKKNKILVLDYLGLKGRRNLIVKASSDVASPSIWENLKPPKSSSIHSLSDILWPSAGSFFLFSFICKMNLITILCICNNGIKKLFLLRL